MDYVFVLLFTGGILFAGAVIWGVNEYRQTMNVLTKRAYTAGVTGRRLRIHNTIGWVSRKQVMTAFLDGCRTRETETV